MKAGYQFGTQRSSINHLLFMNDLTLYAKKEKQLDSLVNTVQIFSSDIGMEFGIDNCGILVMKRGRYKKSEGIKLPNEEEIKQINVDNGCKYLGILEADGIKDKEMKGTIRKEYTRRVRQVLKSKRNGVNIFSAINSRAVAVVRYSTGVVHWRKNELQEIDRKTRKLLTIYRTYHPQSDKDRLYVKRKTRGRGLISVEDAVNIEINSLRTYVDNREEQLLSEVRRERIIEQDKEKNEIQIEHENA